MKRIVLWTLSTVSVVVLLFGYHTSTEGPPSATAATLGSPPAVSSRATGGSAAAGGSGGDGTGDDSGSGSGGRSGTGRMTRGGSSSSGITVTGDPVDTEWGPVQVQLTVKDGRITAVAVPTYPNGNPRDAEINSYALPTLVQETIDAQSARIDMVSGATVTSEGYLSSLQSAIDKAGL